MADETPIVVEDATVDSKGFVADDEVNPTCSEETKKELEFSKDEETLIIRMYNLVGERWPLIAGRIPGRSAEEIEKFWNSRQPTNEKEPQNSSVVVNQLHNVDVNED